jgi:competence protein ComEC
MHEAVRVLFVSDQTGPTTPAAIRATGAFACAAGGELAALWLWRAGHPVPSAVWWGCGLLVLAVGAAGRCGPRAAVLGLALVLLVGGRFTSRILERPADDLAAMLPAPAEPGGGSILTVEGVVVEGPERLSSGGALAGYRVLGESFGLTVRARAVVGESGVIGVRGRVRVMVSGGAPEVEVGQRVRVQGVARAVEAPGNPGESDARLWAAQDGLGARLSVASAALVTVLEPEPGARAWVGRAWLTGRAWLRGRAGAVFGDDPGSPRRAMLAALLLGERERAGEEVRSAFARQGLAHVLAISGFHLAVMAGAALFVVRLTGDRGRLEPALVASLVVLYVVVLPAEAPILRSAAMVLAWLGAESLGRRYDKRALLAWVAIAVLLVRPMDLFSLGYQLTFGITAALVWFGSVVHERMFPAALSFQRHEPPDVFEGRWWAQRATQLVSASVLCWLVATPLAARTVGIVSPAAVVATLVVVPVITVLLWAGYGAMVVGVLVPPAGGVAASVLGWLAGLVVAVVGAFDSVPLTTVYVPRVSAGLTAALTVIVLVWLVRGRLRSPGVWAATLVVGGWLAGELYNAGRLDRGALLRIDTLDVGDGTCHLVRSGRDAMLWDCGSLSPSVGVRTIPRAVRALGAWRVREVVVTHPNYDHYSGLVDVAGPLGVERVSFSRAFLAAAGGRPGGAEAALLAALRGRGVEVLELAAGAEFRLGAASVRVLSPPEPSPFAEANDNSLVARFSVGTGGGERRLMLCGDIQRGAIAALMTPGADLAADILELPHHGSVQPTAMALVEAVGPGVVVQSTGPSRALDVRWNAHREGRMWWTTATDGGAWAEIRGDGSVASGSVRR